MFDALLVNPIINMIVAVYHGLAFVHFPYALAFAIILTTVLIKLALYPLAGMQLKSAKQMQELAPEIAKIKEKYKNDPKQQQLAQMEYFKAKGINPAAGCLPVLLQMPIFLGLYWALFNIVKVTTAADLNGRLYIDWLKMGSTWDTTFFGLPLGKTPSELIPSMGYAIVLVCIITGGLQLLQSKMMLPPASLLQIKPKDKSDDFATSMQKQMLFMMPLMIGFFAFTFPIGVSLYWNVFTIFGIIQQYKVSNWGGLEDWFKFLKK